MKCLLIAYSARSDLATLIPESPMALLPIAGRPLIGYSLMDLKASGIEDVVVVSSEHAEKIRERLGDGEEWGLKLTHTLAVDDETLLHSAFKAKHLLGDRCLVLDVNYLRTPVLRSFLDRTPHNPPNGARGPIVSARIDRQPIGVMGLDMTALSGIQDFSRASTIGDYGHVDLPGRAWRINSPQDLHAANLAAVRGELGPDLPLPALEVSKQVFRGRHSKLPAPATRGQDVFVGRRCHVHPEATLGDSVVLNNDVIVDRRASLERTVVLSGTYIGQLTELKDALVAGDLLMRVDTGAVTRIVDDFLLADTTQPLLGGRLELLLHQLVATLVLVASLPMWPIAALFACLRRPKAPLRKVRIAARPHRSEPGVESYEWAVTAPVLRHLPKLLPVITGRLRLIGVSPLEPDEATARVDEWEYLRDRAPMGLISPTRLMLTPDASSEELRLTEAYYAVTRSLKIDLGLMLKAALALFERRSWQPTAC
ncbi:MAG: NDP-sugar synthase [Acidobacteriota bacterium]